MGAQGRFAVGYPSCRAGGSAGNGARDKAEPVDGKGDTRGAVCYMLKIEVGHGSPGGFDVDETIFTYSKKPSESQIDVDIKWARSQFSNIRYTRCLLTEGNSS